MNRGLEALAQAIGLEADEPLRLRFALACMDRVAHLLGEPRTIANDPESFEPEFAWQVQALRRLHQESPVHAAAHRDRRLLG